MKCYISSSRVALLVTLLYSYGSCEQVSSTSPARRKIYEIVDQILVSQQWVKDDTYDTSRQISLVDQTNVRYPHPEQRYIMTTDNQELILLSSAKLRLFPSANELLTINKSPKRLFNYIDIYPIFAHGMNGRHRIAEYRNIRRRNFGSSDEAIVPFLFYPTGWPIFFMTVFTFTVLLVPLLGCFLVHFGFRIGVVIHTCLWRPVKLLLRRILINWELYNQSWIRYMAPPYFLEPRTTMKMPWMLRNHALEDIPPEVAHRPPMNNIDYTMYVLSLEDYDVYDLEMDEMEFIDDMLQFRDDNPQLVARLLKFRLGDEKFYHYFEEDILSSEEEEDANEKSPSPPLSEPQDAELGFYSEELDDAELAIDLKEYRNAIDTDEAWMHEEYDKTFTGSPMELDEVRKRREVMKKLQEEIAYIHTILAAGGTNKYTSNMTTLPVEKKKNLQQQAKKLMKRYIKFSTKTKERIAELEPSKNIQNVHNVALSKYLPLISKLSHYNHRLNLKHEKQKDPAKRKVQLDVFGGP